MTSKTVTLSADGTTATVATSTAGDMLSTAISSNSAVTGMYGFLQKAAFVLAGMSIQSKRKLDTFNPL